MRRLARYSLQKRLDFNCKQSVNVVVLMRAFWPRLGSRPAGDAALRGFGGDGARAVATERSRKMSHRNTPSKTKVAPAKRAKPAKSGKAAAGSGRTKQETVIGLLKQPTGTTIVAIMNATGWQQHSVRGFFAGVVRKKFGLTLTSEKVDGQRIYRVIAGRPTKSKAKPSIPAPVAV